MSGVCECGKVSAIVGNNEANVIVSLGLGVFARGNKGVKYSQRTRLALHHKICEVGGVHKTPASTISLRTHLGCFFRVG